MNVAVIQLLVLAGIALFLILRLKSVLGTREGYEKPPAPLPGGEEEASRARRGFEVIEGGVDRDITDHVDADSDSAEALARMKGLEPDFSVSEFLQGSRAAYEMILMAFENGDLDDVRGLLGEDVEQTFVDVIAQREDQGLSIEATFVGMRDVALHSATFDTETNEAEITVRLIGELTSVVKDAEGRIVEGDPSEIKRQRDVWTFARVMGTGDPNWQLVATGE